MSCPADIQPSVNCICDDHSELFNGNDSADSIFSQAKKLCLKFCLQAAIQLPSCLDRFFTSGHKDKLPLTLSFSSLFRIILWPFCGRHKGNFLMALYLVIKILYIGNAIGQLFLLNAILDTDFHAFGIDVMRKSFSGEEWAPTTRFPRVTFCDFNIRRLGNNIHRYVIQCTLPVNLFAERIYLVIWFWFVILAAITCYSFLEWFFRAAFRMERHRYIKKHLLLSKSIGPDYDKKILAQFVDRYLQTDGVMVLKLISKNTDAYTVVDITAHLYENYMKEVRSDPRYSSTSSFELQANDYV